MFKGTTFYRRGKPPAIFFFSFLVVSKAFSTPLWEGFSPCEIFFENFARRVKKNILKKIFFPLRFGPARAAPRGGPLQGKKRIAPTSRGCACRNSHGFDSKGIKTLFSSLL